MNERIKRPNYTEEFKKDAIRLLEENVYSCTEVSQRLGIPSSNVSRWVRLSRSEKMELNESGTTFKDLEAENRRLKKENQRLQKEREILKKATAFFAKESS